MPGSRMSTSSRSGVETAGHAEVADAVRRHVQFGVRQPALDEQADQVLEVGGVLDQQDAQRARLLVGRRPGRPGAWRQSCAVVAGPKAPAGGRPRPRRAEAARRGWRRARCGGWSPAFSRPAGRRASTISRTERTASAQPLSGFGGGAGVVAHGGGASTLRGRWHGRAFASDARHFAELSMLRGEIRGDAICQIDIFVSMRRQYVAPQPQESRMNPPAPACPAESVVSERFPRAADGGRPPAPGTRPLPLLPAPRPRWSACWRPGACLPRAQHGAATWSSPTWRRRCAWPWLRSCATATPACTSCLPGYLAEAPGARPPVPGPGGPPPAPGCAHARHRQDRHRRTMLPQEARTAHPEERQLMSRTRAWAPTSSATPTSPFELAAEVALHHHERWDGGGLRPGSGRILSRAASWPWWISSTR